jgi:hypothetical protein
LAIPEASSVNRWYGLEGFGRAKAGPEGGCPERRKAVTDCGRRGKWTSGSFLGCLVQWAGQRGKIGDPVSKKTNEAQEGQNFLGIVRRRDVP